MKTSAGILLHRRARERRQVFLVHPGGPFWANKDEGAWTIPKGEIGSEEDPLTAALREFAEETGMSLDKKDAAIRSNTFRLEWPPRSGQLAEFPEVDRGDWFDLETAALKINPAQREFLERLLAS